MIDSLGNSYEENLSFAYSLDFDGNPAINPVPDTGESATGIGKLIIDYTLDDEVKNPPQGKIQLVDGDDIYNVPQGEVTTESTGSRSWKTQWTIPRRENEEIDATKIKFYVVEANESYFNRSTSEQEENKILHNNPTVVSNFQAEVLGGTLGDEVKFTGTFEDNMFGSCTLSLALNDVSKTFEINKDEKSFVENILGSQFNLSSEVKSILTIDDGFQTHTHELTIDDPIDPLYLDFDGNVTLPADTSEFQSGNEIELNFDLNEDLKDGTLPLVEVEVSADQQFNSSQSFVAVSQENGESWKALWTIPNSQSQTQNQTYEYLRLRMSGTDSLGNTRSNILSNTLSAKVVLKP